MARIRSGLVSLLKAHKRNIAVLLLLLLFLYAVVPQVSGLGDSLDIILSAQPQYLLLALACWIGIFLLAAMLYKILTLYPIAYARTLGAQIAAGFTGKLLPAGLGVAGLNVQYLRKYKHSLGEAVAVVTLNNLVAIAGHLLIIIVFLVSGTALPDIRTQLPTVPGFGLIVAAVAGAALIIIGFIWRRKLASFWRGIGKTLAVYHDHPYKVLLATLVSIPQTFCYLGVLYASSLALGAQLELGSIFMVATFSMLVGTLVPVPGGIVGAEAGLTAGFVAYGLPVEQGLAIALLYRAFIYWLPILPGLIVFAARRRDYL